MKSLSQEPPMQVGKLYQCNKHPFGFYIETNSPKQRFIDRNQCDGAICLLIAIEIDAGCTNVIFKGVAGHRPPDDPFEGSYWKLTFLHRNILWKIEQAFSVDAIEEYWKQIGPS